MTTSIGVEHVAPHVREWTCRRIVRCPPYADEKSVIETVSNNGPNCSSTYEKKHDLAQNLRECWSLFLHVNILIRSLLGILAFSTHNKGMIGPASMLSINCYKTSVKRLMLSCLKRTNGLFFY